MRTRTRIVPFAMTAVLLGGGVAAATTGAAVASPPMADATIQSCLGTAKNYTSAPGGNGRNAHWPATGTYAYTTSNCADINVKTNYDRMVYVCFKKTGTCNGGTWAPKGKWTVVASDVLDNSGFYVQFRGPNRSTGQIAY